MREEKVLTEQESLALISSMISKARFDYEETGVSALMWGVVVVFCSLVTFTSFYTHWAWAEYVWFLTLVAVVPQVIIAIRETKKRKFKSYNDSAIGGIWISFGIALFLFSFFTYQFPVAHAESAYIIFYGIPTFTTGMITRFKPMIYGGILCWIIAAATMFVDRPYTMLLTAVAAFFAWFVPGLILRRRYWKLKRQNV